MPPEAHTTREGEITHAERDDADLVRLAREGDRAAFGELVRRYENVAWATALSYVHCRDTARDLVQEAFVNAWCRLTQLREGAGFGAWLRTIVVRRSLEWLRRARTVRFIGESQVGTLDGLNDADDARFEAKQQRRDLLEAVGMLPAKYREVVLLYYLNDLPIARIAHVMSLPETTVRGRLHQARLKLKNMMIHNKELPMSKADIQQEVENAVARIARRNISETLALNGTTHIALFCGVNTDLEICRTDGPAAVLTGTIAAVGLDDDSARRSAESVRVMTDVVENFAAAGPHEGQVFGGTQGTGGKGIIGLARPSSHWHPRRAFEEGVSAELVGMHPEMKIREEAVLEKLRHDWQRVTRLSVLRETLDDLTLPREAYTDAVRSVFRPNYQGGGICHGDNGMVDLMLAVPAGVGVTVLRCRSLRVSGIQGDINAVQADGLELEDIEGTVALLDCHVSSARRIRGRFLQTHYHVWGGNDDTETALVPSGRRRTELRDLSGEVMADLLSADLEVSGIEGDAMVRNRLGPTRYYLGADPTRAQCFIESDSGEVIVFMREDTEETPTIAVNTIQAQIGSRLFLSERNFGMGWEGLGLRNFASSPPERPEDSPPRPPYLSDPRRKEVNLQVVTRNGEVSFEVVK